MNTECRGLRIGHRLGVPSGVFLISLLVALPAIAGEIGPSFSKVFLPDIIGPGSTSTLQFDISNDFPDPVSDLAFVDNLPAGVVIATPSSAFTDCAEAILSAPDGGTTISMSDGQLGANSGCSVVVNVTSSTIATHMNVSGDLTSSAGNSGPAIDDLVVDDGRPGFSKSFGPSSIPPLHTSTLTLLIDNNLNEADIDFLSFVDNLPPGVLVAEPPRAATDCSSGQFPATLTAIPGTGSISFFSGFVAAMSSCKVTVDVTADSPGVYVNTSGELTSGQEAVSSGFATAQLDVPFVFLNKVFTDDPVAPGQTVTLELILTNPDRNDAAVNIDFTDDLDAVLPGLTAVGLPLLDICGPGSALSGTTLLSFVDGNLGPQSSCTVSVTLQVPADAGFGTYTNTTSPVTFDLDGDPVVENPATDDLIVAPVSLIKEFTDDPVAAGDSVTLEFTIENSSPSSSLSDISFDDNLSAVIAGLVPVGLPINGVCGVDSQLDSFVLLDDVFLSLTGGQLDAAASCTFEVTLQVPADAPPGPYLNTTSAILATADEESVVGRAATDTLIVAGVAAPVFDKAFIDDPVLPGGNVTLEFTITNTDGTDPAVDLAFTDDLGAVLPGLAAVGLPLADVCGIGSTLDGTTVLSLTGGSLAPATSCTFSATLQAPGDAVPGTYPNITSELTGTVGGVAFSGDPATDDLVVGGFLQLTKEFTDDPVLAGAPVTLEFTLVNDSPTDSVTGIQFTDDLDATLTGLAATGLPLNEICGAGSTLTGTGLLSFVGGSLGAGVSCTFSVTLNVPAAAAPGEYQNTTSVVDALLGGDPVTASPASDTLIVGEELSLSKSFTDDPGSPGSQVTLEFTVDYLAGATNATDIAFTDDLEAALPGLAAVGLPLNDVCGPGSQISGTSVLDFTGGTLVAATSCTFAVTLLVPAGALPGTYSNVTSDVTAIVDGSPISGPPATDDLEVIAGVEFEKLTNGQDADLPPGPFVGVGDPVTWEYVLTNTSLDVLTDIVVVDSRGVSVSCPLTTLGPGETLICTGNGVATLGQYSNVGTATGVLGTRQIELTDPSHYLGVDTAPPTVANVDSVPDTGDGQLEDCETAQVLIGQLLVSFSEPVQDPPGDSQPDDVTNPANYLLVGTGADNEIETLVCGPVMGDDVAILISGVTYDAGTLTATLDLGSSLPTSLYRLLVCGSTSIRDLAGNALDGNGDGMGGDDYLQIFRADPANLLANGHFDCSLLDWIVSETVPGAVSHSTEDVDDSSLSGSAEIFNPSVTGIPESFSLGQCVTALAGSALGVDASTRLAAAPGVFVSFTESCEFFDLAACSGSSLGVALNTLLLQDTAGSWISVEGQFTAPVSAASALCIFQFNTSTGQAFDAFLDDTILDNSLIFADGFESGDTSAWSASVP